jgi:hypothetical protein
MRNTSTLLHRTRVNTIHQTTSELVKVMTENVALEMEYNTVKQESDEAV